MAQIVARSTVFSLVIAVLGAGCSKTVVLGSECPGIEGPCELEPDSPQQGVNPVATDAAQMGGYDAGNSGVWQGPDAGSPFDANGIPSDARPPVELDAAEPPRDTGAPFRPEAGPSDAGSSGVLQNPSFELQENPAFGALESQFGNDVFVSDLGGYVPVAGALFANVDPWFACWLGVQVESDLGGVAGGLSAPQGQALITASFGPFIFLPGLFQFLERPLEVGRSYSFSLDVINSGRTRAALALGATNIPCTTPALTATTEEIRNTTRFENYCLTITPTRALDTFALIPVNLDAEDATGQISFDNIKQVASCPDAGTSR